jgi:hypothetical protein
MSALARSRVLFPNSSATPHSVTIVRTCARVVTTPAPVLSDGVILDTVPPAAVDGSAMTARPSAARPAPRTKSICPPTPEYSRWPIESATTCPVRSTSMTELMATIRSNERITCVSFVKSTGRISTIGFVVDEVIQPLRAQDEGGHDLAAIALLARPVDDARLDEVDHGVREHLGVNPEVALVAQGQRRRCRNGPDAKLQRGAVGNEVRHELPDPALDVPDRIKRVCIWGQVDFDGEIDLVHVDEAIAERAGHRAVELDDHGLRRPDRRVHRLDAGPKRTEAVTVRWRGIDEHRVEGQGPRREQPGNVRKEDRHVVGAPLMHGRASVRADEQRPVTEMPRHFRRKMRSRAFDVEVDHPDVLEVVRSIYERVE